MTEDEKLVLEPEEEKEELTLPQKIGIGIAAGIGIFSLCSAVGNFRAARKIERENQSKLEGWLKEHNANVDKMEQLKKDVINTRRDWMATAQRIADRLNVKVDRDVI